MKNTNFKRYYLMIAAVVFLASVYPLYMGIRVIWYYVQNGFVYAENYPKYIIPYTPICLAVIIGVLQLPLILRRFKKYPVLFASIVSVAVFVAAELLLENMVLVTDSAKTTLESWQMYACYIPPISLGHGEQ